MIPDVDFYFHEKKSLLFNSGFSGRNWSEAADINYKKLWEPHLKDNKADKPAFVGVILGWEEINQTFWFLTTPAKLENVIQEGVPHLLGIQNINK